MRAQLNFKSATSTYDNPRTRSNADWHGEGFFPTDPVPGEEVPTLSDKKTSSMWKPSASELAMLLFPCVIEGEAGRMTPRLMRGLVVIIV